MAVPDPRDPGGPMPSPAEAEVLAVNASFYDAFERRDLDAMSDVWEHSDRVVCVHPGWGLLRGWGAVSGSWFALFDGPQQLQFILTDEQVEVSGDTAWVTCNENLLGGGTTQAVAATNIFVRHGDRWQLVDHHGSPVVQRSGPED